MIKTIHSYWAYLVLAVLVLAVFKALLGYFGKKDYDAKAFRVSLFTLIVSHIQLLIGLLLYFTSERFGLWSDLGVGEVMKNAQIRLYLVEHPTINILAVQQQYLVIHLLQAKAMKALQTMETPHFLEMTHFSVDILMPRTSN